MEDTGELFLHQKDPTLHISKPVVHEQERKRIANEKASQKPTDKIADWLKVIEETHLGHRDDPMVAERINNFYHKEYVIKRQDIPESYFDTQKRLIREQGYGDVEIHDEQRNQLAEVIIKDQTSTLDNWTNYFMSPDSTAYPTWAKYWAFTSMVKLSTYDKEKHVFGKRDKGTVAPFPDLNREALSYVVDLVVKKAKKESIPAAEDNPELAKLLEGVNFGKLYAYAIEKVTPTETNELLNTQGKWVKYPQNSDHMPLAQSLQGYGTGWCTTGESTAKTQLQCGDFYVYYSNNKEGKSIIPRIAIRMQGNKIGEVRGVGPDQNLDPYISDVVNNKLQEFPDGKSYQKKSADMKCLTVIDRKRMKGEELPREDLRFLYQLDSKIEGFGYNEDPRIQEILAGRDVRSDLSLATGFSKEQISLTEEEALKGGIKYHYLDLDLPDLESATGLIFPETVAGSLCLRGLKSAEGMILPQTISGDLVLENVKSPVGLVLPQTIGGDLILHNIKSPVGLVLPQTIGGSIILPSLKSSEGLILPQTIGGMIKLTSLESANGLNFPELVGGSIDFTNLDTAKGIVFPKIVEGELYLPLLRTIEGLTLPKVVREDLVLSNLESAEGLIFPDIIGGVFLNGLKSTDGLTLPEKIEGDLALSNIVYAENLKLPKVVGGMLQLYSLKKAKGLVLPLEVEGDVILKSLVIGDGVTFPEKIGRDLDLEDLATASGLKLPKYIGGDLSLGNINNVTSLVLPTVVNGDIFLQHLHSADGLTLPESLGGEIYLSGSTISV
jgi:hypothetical protein